MLGDFVAQGTLSDDEVGLQEVERGTGQVGLFSPPKTSQAVLT
jgi:hypothetical protein